MIDAKAIPLFPFASFDDTVAFYRALGFELTYDQKEPYHYAAVRLGGFDLHFGRATGADAKGAGSTCLVFVADVHPLHSGFADGLRSALGRVPTAGYPRLTRLRKGQTRFTAFDPSGNAVTYINRDEPDMDYTAWGGEKRSKLGQTLDKATFLRDTYYNDAAAAKLLDSALARAKSADPVDRALALAARAELAVALDDADRAKSARAELEHLPITAADRERYREELLAADELERWRG